jgi:hypothetical protein
MVFVGSSRFVARCSESVDAERLEACAKGVAERQERLAAGLRFCVSDCSQMSGQSDGEVVLAALRREQLHDADDATLTVLVARRGPGKDVLAFVADRRLVDPLSLVLFVSDVKLLYESARFDSSSLPPLSMQFDEYEAWRRDALSRHGSLRQLAFWQDAMAKPLPSLELRTDGAKVAQQPPPQQHELQQQLAALAGARRVALSAVTLSPQLCDALQRLALETHTACRVLVLAGFHLLLARYTGTNDVVVGMHVVGRANVVEISEREKGSILGARKDH